jgi:hypothetical protein
LQFFVFCQPSSTSSFGAFDSVLYPTKSVTSLFYKCFSIGDAMRRNILDYTLPAMWVSVGAFRALSSCNWVVDYTLHHLWLVYINFINASLVEEEKA